jgi:DNA-binding response OmpR family regulator
MTPRVLVIDDDADVRAIARLTLVQLGGFDVTEACDGAQGVAHCRERRPDAILLDLMMPDMDGLQCLEALRDALGNALPPVLLMTARSGVEGSLPPGLSGVVAKPFEPRELVNRVREVIGS